MQIIKDTIKPIYENIYSKTYNWVDFEINETERNIKVLENFCDILDKEIGIESVGENFIFDYTVFQFRYYEDKKTARDVQLNWIYGQKAWCRWKNKNEHWNYFNSLYCQNKAISKPEYKVNIDEEIYNDRERNRYYGTNLGQYYCQKMALNSNRKSKLCRFCKFKKECYEKY